MHTRSLKQRALAILTAFFLLFFVVLAYVLDQSVQRPLQDALRQQLELQVRALLTEIEFESDGTLGVAQVQEPRLARPAGGLYAAVFDEQGREVWRSVSIETSGMAMKHPLAISEGLGEHAAGSWRNASCNAR